MSTAPHSKTSAEDLQDLVADGVRTKDELRVDEASLESFPASDVPSWTPIHAGTPYPSKPRVDTPRELSSRVKRDFEALASADTAGRNELITSAFLDADRAVNRIPLANGRENIEVAIRGVDEGPELIIGARYDEGDPTGIVILLGLGRILEGRRFARTVRLVALTDGVAGARVYVERLQVEELGIHGALVLERLAFASGERARVTMLSNLRSRKIAEEARDAFRHGTELEVRVITSPLVFPLAPSSLHRAFWKGGYPAAVVTNRRASAVKHASHELDHDAMADVVFGLAAVVARLCGGEGH